MHQYLSLNLLLALTFWLVDSVSGEAKDNLNVMTASCSEVSKVTKKADQWDSTCSCK